MMCPFICHLCAKLFVKILKLKILTYVKYFSTFDVGIFLNSLRMKLQNMRLYAKCPEGMNKCWNEFEDILYVTVY